MFSNSKFMHNIYQIHRNTSPAVSYPVLKILVLLWFSARTPSTGDLDKENPLQYKDTGNSDPHFFWVRSAPGTVLSVPMISPS